MQQYSKVKELPPELHWFCPRSSIRDHRLFFEEDLIDATQAESDLPDAERERKIEESNSRKTLVYEALQIFAFDGNDAVPLQTWLQENLDIHMSRCETCARQYHRGRTELKEKLEGFAAYLVLHLEMLTAVDLTRKTRCAAFLRDSTKSTPHE